MRCACASLSANGRVSAAAPPGFRRLLMSSLSFRREAFPSRRRLVSAVCAEFPPRRRLVPCACKPTGDGLVFGHGRLLSQLLLMKPAILLFVDQNAWVYSGLPALWWPKTGRHQMCGAALEALRPPKQSSQNTQTTNPRPAGQRATLDPDASRCPLDCRPLSDNISRDHRESLRLPRLGGFGRLGPRKPRRLGQPWSPPRRRPPPAPQHAQALLPAVKLERWVLRVGNRLRMVKHKALATMSVAAKSAGSRTTNGQVRPAFRASPPEARAKALRSHSSIRAEKEERTPRPAARPSATASGPRPGEGRRRQGPKRRCPEHAIESRVPTGLICRGCRGTGTDSQLHPRSSRARAARFGPGCGAGAPDTRPSAGRQ